jgi:hypothetical protein
MTDEILANAQIADLLVQQATEGLSSREAIDLRTLLDIYAEADTEVIERTAAAIVLSGLPVEEGVPESLRQRLATAADSFVASPFGLSLLAGCAAEKARPMRNRPQVPASRGAFHASLGWAAAAAAAVAVAGWWPRLSGPDGSDRVASGSSETIAPAQRRLDLAGRPGVVMLPFSGTDDAAATNLSGDVVWDGATQTGFMRFQGLAANDPAEFQYQLWIFDATRDQARPVDGGVFDVPSAAADEVIVPIDAKLHVDTPVMFAVTVERPGGVVVSARERLVALTEPATG